MQKFASTLAALGLGLSQLLSLAFGVNPLPAKADQPQVVPSETLQRLMQVFSPDIQTTLNACWEQGKVDLAAGADQDGSVTCGDGSTHSEVAFTDYVETVSDILAASSLVGFRAALQSNPGISPEMITTFLADPQATVMLRSTLQTAIAQSNLLPTSATDSTALLTDEVITRLLPTLQDAGGLETLLGTSEQYSQVVDNFCSTSGMSIEQIGALVPGLNQIQLYAICIQASGVADEVLRLAN